MLILHMTDRWVRQIHIDRWQFWELTRYSPGFYLLPESDIIVHFTNQTHHNAMHMLFEKLQSIGYVPLPLHYHISGINCMQFAMCHWHLNAHVGSDIPQAVVAQQRWLLAGLLLMNWASFQAFLDCREQPCPPILASAPHSPAWGLSCSLIFPLWH